MIGKKMEERHGSFLEIIRFWYRFGKEKKEIERKNEK